MQLASGVPAFGDLTLTQRVVAVVDLRLLVSAIARGPEYEPREAVVPFWVAAGHDRVCSVEALFLPVTTSGVPVPGPQVGFDHLPDVADGRSARQFVDAQPESRVGRAVGAAAYRVPFQYVCTAERIAYRAPDLLFPMRDGVVTLHDACRVQFEPCNVRVRAASAVRRGLAHTVALAVRRLYGREPVQGVVNLPGPACDSFPAMELFCKSSEFADLAPPSLTASQRAVAAADVVLLFPSIVESVRSGSANGRSFPVSSSLDDVSGPVGNPQSHVGVRSQIGIAQLPDLVGGGKPTELAYGCDRHPFSIARAAHAYAVGVTPVRAALRIYRTAPDLIAPLRDGKITLHDAGCIHSESSDVRHRAVAAVLAGQAASLVAAVRMLYGREPVHVGSGFYRRSCSTDMAGPCHVSSLSPSQRAVAAAVLLELFEHPSFRTGTDYRARSLDVGVDDLPVLRHGRTARDLLGRYREQPGFLGRLSIGKAAAWYGVSRRSARRARTVLADAPDLGIPLSNGLLTVNDAVSICREPLDVRTRLVAEVSRGARTAAEVLRRHRRSEPLSLSA